MVLCFYKILSKKFNETDARAASNFGIACDKYKFLILINCLDIYINKINPDQVLNVSHTFVSHSLA